METRIALRYSGPDVDAGLMDVYAATANMVAFSEFVVAAAKIQFGERTEATAKVAGFDRGSFVTDICFEVVGAAATIFSAITPSQLLDLIREAFTLWKHLKGLPPKKIEHQVNQTVEVENNNGEVIQISVQSLTLVLSDKGSESTGRFVREALGASGIDRVDLIAESKTIADATQNEREYFVPVAPSQDLTDAIVTMSLQIEAPVFRDGNKWRFSDGLQSFHASIEDEGFLRQVNAGERFGKGDILRADVRISQRQVGGKLAAERIVVKVHEHKIAPLQYGLPDQ